MSFALPYTCKRVIAQFIMPVPLVIELYVLGWCLARFTRFKRAGLAAKVLSGCLFLAFGYGLGSSYLYRIERQYPPFDPTAEQCESLRGCDVVVLGQGMAPESDLPARYRNNAAFLQRMLEGVRVSRLIPESRILVSMAGDAPLKDKALFLDEYAKTVGVSRDRFLILDGARDTTEEARLALNVSRTNRLVVATSAAHIPRAMKIFQKASACPVPAPCDYVRFAPATFQCKPSCLPLPSVRGFETAQRAAHEWLGMLYEASTR